jgi:hypothetical protein
VPGGWANTQSSAAPSESYTDSGADSRTSGGLLDEHAGAGLVCHQGAARTPLKAECVDRLSLWQIIDPDNNGAVGECHCGRMQFVTIPTDDACWGFP